MPEGSYGGLLAAIRVAGLEQAYIPGVHGHAHGSHKRKYLGR